MLEGKILITGGSGFIGRGIMRQAIREKWPCEFTIYNRDELKQDLCRSRFPNAEYVLGDVRDGEKLSLLLRFHDICIHAAAAKYVPQSAYNVNEFVNCNIDGTRSLIMAAFNSKQLKCVVNLSTDKAVQPANLYGLTKATVENLFLEASRYPIGPRFVQSRYGNVLGSTGSVIPVLKRQYTETGKVSLTDPTSTRFWQSVEEAVELIHYAVNVLNTGQLIIPSARSLSLSDLACAVVPKAEQNIIGLRPGEKPHETLLQESESVRSRSVETLDQEAYVYDPDDIAPHDSSFRVTSDVANSISIEEFAKLAEESERV